ncbi:MAG: hypothetical protein WCS37_13905 [Chloroflexota bacterium]|nr:hypothetical protein [Chloroflexota bacterium]
MGHFLDESSSTRFRIGTFPEPHLLGLLWKSPENKRIVVYSGSIRPDQQPDILRELKHYEKVFLAHDIWHGLFPYKIYCCTSLAEAHEVKELPRQCRYGEGCIIWSDSRSLCPIKIALQGMDERRRTALLMGFKITE